MEKYTEVGYKTHMILLNKATAFITLKLMIFSIHFQYIIKLKSTLKQT
jgi:hypothetical protein